MTGRLVAIVTTAEAGAPLHAVPDASLESGKGLVGDRYYQHGGTFSEKLKNTADWELTLIESEEIDRFNQSQQLSLPPASFRRNLVTAGVRLNDLVGRRFRVGAAELEGLRLCEPCAHLGRLVGPAVVKGMVHRAGLRARIVSGATVHIGDAIAVTQLRPATSKDAAEVARLAAQLGYPVAEAIMRMRLENLLASPTHVVMVAEDGAGLVGWIAGEARLSLESDPRVEIIGLVVDTAARRAGIGRQLVAEIERWSLARGCDMVFVRSNIARTESHPFYERLGYQRAKTQHAYKRQLQAVP